MINAYYLVFLVKVGEALELISFTSSSDSHISDTSENRNSDKDNSDKAKRVQLLEPYVQQDRHLHRVRPQLPEVLLRSLRIQTLDVV